jgi:acyl transferase domain-containing protein/acyl-CoA synthetase (AMP-forming)/AMP-acid ligase II
MNKSYERRSVSHVMEVESRAIEALLLEDRSVDSCVVLARETADHSRSFVAFVVPIGSFTPHRLHSRLEAILPSSRLPSAYVPVSALPLTEDGRIDEKALLALPVIDDDLLQRWEARIQAMAGVDQVVVVAHEQTALSEPISLANLLPEENLETLDHHQRLLSSIASKPPQQVAQTVERPAIVHGSALSLRADSLSDSLYRAARQHMEHGVLYILPDGLEVEQTYPALLDDAQRIAAGLQQLGLKPHDKVIFQIDCAQDFIPAFWGCVLAGVVAAPISIAPTYDRPNSTVAKLYHAWQLLQQPLVLSSTPLVDRVRSLSTLADFEGLRVETVAALRASPAVSEAHPSRPHDAALLLFTSGSTGAPKGVVLSHGNLLAMMAGTIDMNHFTDRDITLNWMPLDHVGAIVFLSIMSVDLGCRQLHVPPELILQHPLTWLDLIARHHASISWAPNFAFSLLNDRAEAIGQRQWDLSSMRFLVNAGEAIVAKTARKFLQLLRAQGLPADALRPAFGMSETCSGITWSEGFTLENSTDDTLFVELGRPIPGASMRIVDDRGHVLEELAVGRVQFRGPSVTSGYYQNPELNQEVFVDEGWFNTGDLGYMDDGRLVITGREKDDIIINGVNFYSHDIEAVIETLEEVETSYTAACAVRVPGVDTDQLAVFFHTSIVDPIMLHALFKSIRGRVVQQIGVNVDYLIPVPKATIPKTSIGKIQRSLLKQQFAQGEFDTILHRHGTPPPSAQLLPRWFYERRWRRKQVQTTGPLSGNYLVFLDDMGLGAALCRHLERLEVPCVRVEAGSEFRQLDAGHFRIAPGEPAHYGHLLQALLSDDVQPDNLVHLWTYRARMGAAVTAEWLEQAQTYGAYSLLFLVQSLADVLDRKRPVRLHIASNQAQDLQPGDEIAYEKAPLLGLVKTVSQEMPWLRCHHVDFDAEEVDRHATQLLGELQAVASEREVAYRGEQRWVPHLERVDLDQVEPQGLPFASGRMYVISGGLGGIGFHVARYLLQRYDARLLLLGRTPLPARDTWNFSGASGDPLRQKMEALQALERLSGRVIYRAVNVCDRDRLQQVIEEVEAEWGHPLDGVIHLAGTYHERPLLEETRDSFDEALRAKLIGTWNLHQLIESRPESLFISFASVTGYFGGATAGALAAASRFQEAFARYQQRTGYLQSYCYSWGGWHGIGIGRDAPMQDLMRARGYYALTAKQGLASLLAGLYVHLPQLWIGLEGENPLIRREVATDCRGTQRVTAYVACAEAARPSRLQDLVVPDRFGTLSTCTVQPLNAWPLTESGAIDRAFLTAGQSQEGQKAPQTQVEQQIAQVWQSLLGLSQVGLHDNFFELGGHSLLLVQAQSRLRDLFGTPLSVVDMFKYPTIAAMAQYLNKAATEDRSVQQGLDRASIRAAHRTARSSDIAVIGLACRFPGADHVDAFWHNLLHGVESITFFTDEELIASGLDPALVRHPHYVKAKPILSDAECFDAAFFDYSAREAEWMDPQHRLLLECSWACIEAAGYNPHQVKGKVGIYAGASMNTYLLNNLYGNRDRLDIHDTLQVAALDSMGGFQMMVANDKDYLTTRISYKLNLTGPSVNVQTACSTALLAVHMACQSLLQGECDMALAGGASVQAPQKAGHLYQDGMIVSSDGHCRAFDARADGTVFGSGVGVVLLKRLGDALADGDPIKAVIKGSATNNDGGTKVGYLAPSGDGQAAVVTEALAVAGIEPDTIGFVEAHGTGTSLGDPIEISGLTQAFRAKTDREGFCAVGSVKTNVGHLQIASGIVGLIKAVLALEHGVIPPSLHFETPNPAIDWDHSPFYVNTTPVAWKTTEGPRRAGVNSLGIGGSNVHVILEEAPAPVAVPRDVDRPQHVLTLSARTEPALREQARRYAAFLSDHPDVSLADVCFTANTGRRAFDHRLSVVASSAEQLREDLGEFVRGAGSDRVRTGQRRRQSHPKTAFLFTGQGAQYAGMGRQLYETQPTFRQILDHCQERLEPLLKVPLLEVLYPADADALWLDRTAYTQPALFALEYALAELWKSWGIAPAVVMGHSLGEYVAACVAGVFDLEDGLTLVAERARLMQALPTEGEMAVVFAGEARLRELLAPWPQDVAIAAINGPEHTVISGRTASVRALTAALQTAGIKTQSLNTSHAFHSPLMEPMLIDFARVAGRIDYTSPQIDMVSNLTGELISDAIATPEYWCRHIRQPVQFMRGMETLREAGCNTFVEIGPKPVLLGMGARCLEADGGIWLSSLRQGRADWQQLLQSLSRLSLEQAVDWEGFDRDYPRRRVTLPTYPFQRQRYWLAPSMPETQGAAPHAQVSVGRPQSLLGSRLSLPMLQETIYENQFNTHTLPFLRDHRVFGHVVASGACHIAMLITAAQARFGTAACVLKNLYFPQPLVLAEGRTRTVQVVLKPESGEHVSCQLVSFAADHADDPNVAWATHAAGELYREQTDHARVGAVAAEPLHVIWERCPETITAASFVEEQGDRHIHLGPSYRWIDTLRRGAREAVCRLQAPSELDGLEDVAWHPGLIDACFGLLLATAATPQETWLPFSIEEVRVYQKPKRFALWGHLTLRPNRLEDRRRVGDVYLCDESGQVIMACVGLEARPAQPEAVIPGLANRTEARAYDIAWHPMTSSHAPMTAPISHADQWLVLVDRQGAGQQLAQRLRADGARCIVVEPSQDYALVGPDHYRVNPASLKDFQLLLRDGWQTKPESALHVIHFWSLDEPSFVSASPLPHAQTLSCGSALHLVQALAEADWPQAPRLWLVTRGAQAVDHHQRDLSIQQAPLWGFGQVVTLEHPDYHCTCIDLDPAAASQAMDPLLTALSAPRDETRIALRHGECYVARLRPRPLAAPDRAPHIHADATYLLTGGTGGLGLRVAEWLVAQGARHVVLVSRRGGGADVEVAVARMQQAGARVAIMLADVADRDAMVRIFDDVQATLPVLRGVIHCAGMIEDRMLTEQRWERFQRVFPAKLHGAWTLHQLTENTALDFFVLFSSAASIVGNVGQSNYAAANAFLDGLAHYRRQKGLVATSINWGPWDQVGIAASDALIREHMARQGFVGLSPESGLQLFERVLAADVTQPMVMACDWQAYLQQLPAPQQLFAELATAVGRAETDAVETPSTPDILHVLKSASPSRQKQILRTLVQDAVQHILGEHHAEGVVSDQPLTEQGLDSLMAVQLRNVLGNWFHQALPVSLAFNYPTIDDIVTYVVETRLDEMLADVETLPAASEQGETASAVASAREVLAEIDHLLDGAPGAEKEPRRKVHEPGD